MKKKKREHVNIYCLDMVCLCDTWDPQHKGKPSSRLSKYIFLFNVAKPSDGGFTRENCLVDHDQQFSMFSFKNLPK